MVYFFTKGPAFLRCEIWPGRPHVFTVIEPGGLEHTDRYQSSAQLHDRWEAVRDQLLAEDWNGPFGRDARA